MCEEEDNENNKPIRVKSAVETIAQMENSDTNGDCKEIHTKNCHQSETFFIDFGTQNSFCSVACTTMEIRGNFNFKIHRKKEIQISSRVKLNSTLEFCEILTTSKAFQKKIQLN